ncbi:MAG: ABC transporter ATP-binding protein [Spirochaetes bacterium]|nr:ABC transporter ATP-binding protein [Spirochaetota bacterium]
MKLKIENLSFSYNCIPVLDNVNLETSPASITALIGPNAAGKTTLLKCIAGILKPKGRVLLNGRAINNLKIEKISSYIGYLPQEGFSSAALRVFEAVLLGRVHSLSWRISDDNFALVSQVLEGLGIDDLASRYIGELSGGQQQMVSIAQALIRRPEVLLLDEPTNSLDLQHQLEVIDVIREVTRKRGITTLIAMHDLNLAARYADEFVVMNRGKVYISGTSESVMTSEMVRSVYGVNAAVYMDDEGVPQVTPKSSVRRKKGGDCYA